MSDTTTAAAAADERPAPDDEPRLRLSFSRADTYQRCPLQYRYAYVDKLPGPPRPHQLLWGRIHAALEPLFDRKLPDPPSRDELRDALYHAWDTSGFADTDRDTQLSWYRHAQTVLDRTHERLAADWTPPVAVEQWFELPIGSGVDVVGSIDLVVPTDPKPSGDGQTHASRGLGVVDWKTNRRAKTRTQVASSLQLGIYALAVRHLYGTLPDWVALDFVVPGVRVTVPIDDIDTDAAVAALRDVAAGVRAGEFPPQPNRLCDWCDYRAVCPAYDGDGPDVPGLAVRELEQLERRRARDENRARELRDIVDRFAAQTHTDVDTHPPAAPPADRGDTHDGGDDGNTDE